MKKINQFLKELQLKPHRYVKNGKATIIDTDDGRFVIKKKLQKDEIFKYLDYRNFDYYPKMKMCNDEYEIREYIDNLDLPSEQKMLDLVNLVGLLHNKTTHYKEIDFADYKTIYEDISNNIEYLNSYYTDMITLIESKIYMSPSEYLLARNISRIFGALNFCKSELDKWYDLVKDKTKQRIVVLHNNLDLSHFISSDKNYLLSWEKSKLGIPIFDFYVLYKRHSLDFDFSELLKHYENNYPLHEEERKLLFILIALPDKVELVGSNYLKTKQISHLLDEIYKTEHLISPYYSENNVHN